MGAGAKPGERRGGRKKGSVNKKSKDVAERLEQLGCDPIEGMFRIAQLAEKGLPVLIDGMPLIVTDDKGEQKEITKPDYVLAGNMYKELAQYVAPKRKAIEHSTEQDKELRISWLGQKPPATTTKKRK